MRSRLRQMADLVVNPNRFWRETVQETRDMLREAVDTARTGRIGIAAFVLTIWAVGTLICVAVIVLAIASLF